MRNLLIFLLAMTVSVWSIPKPIESITNYNVMLIHGAYGRDKGFLDVKDSARIQEAYAASKPLDNGAALGRYRENLDDKPRLLHWLTTKVFEEPEWSDAKDAIRSSSIYAWRSFTNPANSSIYNAYELGYRSWNKDGKFGKRRALVEEAQEVKASIQITKNGKDSLYMGQIALDSIRKNPDLYSQLVSRYIFVGHSMGGFRKGFFRTTWRVGK